MIEPEPLPPGSRTVAELAEVIQRETETAHAATIAKRSLTMRLALQRVADAMHEALERGLREQLAAELERRGFGADRVPVAQ